MKPATAIRGPWPGVKPKPDDDVSYLEVVARPYVPEPNKHNKGRSKYDKVFEQLSEGHAVRCPPDRSKVVCHALNKWLSVRNKDKQFRAAYTAGDDGMGYIHIIPRKPKKGQA